METSASPHNFSDGLSGVCRWKYLCPSYRKANCQKSKVGQKMATQVIPSVTALTKTANDYSRTRHYWENPRMQGWGWRSSGTTETNCYIRSIRGGGRLPVDHTWSSPRLVQQHMERPPLSLQFFQWEKRTWGWGWGWGRGGKPATLSVYGNKHLLWNHTPGTAGESVGLNLYGSARDQEEGKCLQQPAPRSWQRPHLFSVQVINPSSSFAHWQQQDGGALWPGNLKRCRAA